MKNILIEGSNASGKSTATKILKELFPESNFIEFHDFYHEHTINQFHLQELHKTEHWQVISPEDKMLTEEYLQTREDIIFEFLHKQRFNRNIIERLLLTHVVYSKILFDNDLTDYLISREQELIETNTCLILITCEEDVMKNILEKNIRTRPGRMDATSQYHLKSIDICIKKNILYNEYFRKLKNVEKLCIVNDGSDLESFRERISKITKEFLL